MMKSETKKLHFCFFLLLFFLGCTIGFSYLDLGWGNAVLAYSFAFTKSGLILKYFMHYKEEKGLSTLYFFLGLVMLATLIIGVLDDVLFRARGA